MDPTSDTTTPSSPPKLRKALITSSSPPPQRCSSPPSSPPGFPWENLPFSKSPTSKPQKPSNSAFSLLGKRPRNPLSPTSANPRPTKKPTTTITPSSANNGKKLTQLQISLGQSTRRTCPVCGMEFIPSLAEDSKLHEKFHRRKVSGWTVPKNFVEATAEDKKFAPPKKMRFETPGDKGTDKGREGDAIIRIDAKDRPNRRKLAMLVLESVQKELGAVRLCRGGGGDVWSGEDGDRHGHEHGHEDEDKNEGRGFVAYLHVRERRCVGFLLTEEVREGFVVVEKKKRKEIREAGEGKESETGKRKTSSALEALRARRSAAAEEKKEVEERAVEVSEKKVEVRLGVSRIWTLEACRGEEIAGGLLDVALTDQKITDKRDVAFSQPTQAGARLARKWFGRMYGWCVYA